MSELGECPFCGGAARIVRESDPDGAGTFYFVSCTVCSARTTPQFASHGNDCPLMYQEVRDRWNRRPHPAPVGEVRGWWREDGIVENGGATATDMLADGYKPLVIQNGEDWKDAVLTALADAGMDAPMSELPSEILKRIIGWHVQVATDTTLNPQPTSPKIVWERQIRPKLKTLIDRRPDPAPVGVRVPDAIDAGTRSNRIGDKEWFHWSGRCQGFNECRDETLRLNPQPGAVLGDQAWHDITKLRQYLEEAGHPEGGDALMTADSLLRTLTNTDKDALARKLYGTWTDNQDIHCNRFPSWNELHEGERVVWRRKAADSTLTNTDKGAR